MSLADLINRFFSVERRVRRALPIRGVGPLVAIETPTGTLIRDTRTSGYNEDFDGWITSAGPNGEPDYTDAARYWVKKGLPERGIAETDTFVFDLAPPSTDDKGKSLKDDIVTVTNSPDIGPNAHETDPGFPRYQRYLHIGQHVRVRAVYAVDGTRHYVMSEPPPVGTFYCTAVEDGTGAQGSRTTAATYKYTVTDPWGRTHLSVDTVRPRSNGRVNKATAGWGAINNFGTFVFDAFESPFTVECAVP